MKDLKGFAIYLRKNHLKDFAKENLRIINTLDIPLMKHPLIVQLSQEQLFEQTVVSLDKFLISIENDTAIEDVKNNLKNWEENKTPGFSKSDIQLADLVHIYSAQKRALIKFLSFFTSDVNEVVNIINELEEYYVTTQGLALTILLKIQKETEASLLASERQLQLMVSNIMGYAIFMIDTAGHIISWNQGAVNINGYLEEEIIGKHISIFYTNEDIEQQKPEHNLKIAKENGRCESQGWRIKKDGYKYWADSIFTAIYNESGVLEGFAKITHDISDRKKAEDELKQKTLELLRSNQELEQFAYVASHDLQEPLRMVTSYLQLIEKRYKDKLDQDGTDFIGFAVDGSSRMRVLIQSLLEYSRVNRIKPFEPINVNDLLNEVIQNLGDAIKEQKATVLFGAMPIIYGDFVLIGQLFQNLIENAIKFKGNNDPEVLISAKKENNEYLFSVKDNGIGMKKEYLDKIFVIFQRLNNKEKYPGTGIGLAICKKIVERHNGKIWVESEVDKGSTFYFTIKEK
ncbi:MAG: ATP-binding protein [Bacteroidota bacterium]